SLLRRNTLDGRVTALVTVRRHPGHRGGTRRTVPALRIRTLPFTKRTGGEQVPAGCSNSADGEMNGVKNRTIVVLVCFAVSGFFVANVLATARPDGTAVTVPTVPTTVPTVATTVPTVPTTVPTVATTVPTVATTVSTVVPTVPTTTVRASTPVTTASVTTPSSIPVGTTAATKASTTVAVQTGTHAPAPRGPVKTNGKPGTTSAASEGSAAVAGPTVSAAGPSMPVVASRARKPVVALSRLRLERVPGRRSAVGLRLVPSRPARVRV